MLDYKDQPDLLLYQLLMPIIDKMDALPKTFGDAKMMLDEG